ncbi:unnamed protein product [Trifolium pratense]|uniref:Uncharacterized protein n=1 Tax=Trifolium pratense TaxID=57577 RepID=A0ACB0ITJ3_TRIPR|nr:unnamed protein product [Trifolium pratense]
MDVVQLHLVINGQFFFCKGYYEFSIGADHFLVCDLRLLYNDEEWLSIDALLLKHEWNQVQISYEVKKDYSNEASHRYVTLSEWGVFVYKQGTVNLEENVQFTCPTKDPIMTSNDASVSENCDDI